MDAIYFLGLLLTSPVWLYRMIRHKRYRTGWAQRFGAVPSRYGLQPILWIHGVSLGEINAARGLIRQLHSQLPDYRIVVSSTTDTGLAAARRLFAADHMVFHWPLDFTFTVRRALKRLRPDLVVLMEGEAWPNFLARCAKRNIPVVIVNGRISAKKGYRRYKKLGPLAAKLFNRLTAIGVQDEVYAERFLDLGVAEKKIHLTGMMKFDSAEISDRLAGAEALAAALGITAEQSLLVAGGSGPGEEKMILDFWPVLKAKYPRARLALVPRKPERFDEVARLIQQTGFSVIRRSQRPDGSTGEISADSVILGDTMGELRKFYSLAACVFVGRSLVPMGGSDMIESAALGKPTAFGPHTFNFPQAECLVAHGCVEVSNAASLMRQWQQWLQDPVAAGQAGRTAQQYVQSQQGATQRNVEMICDILGRTAAVAPGAIAMEKISRS